MCCESCGYSQEIAAEPLQPSPKPLDIFLPDPQDHAWAAGARLLTCRQCGAQTIFGSTYTSLACPYCGSAVLAHTGQDLGLMQPQALVPMSVEKITALGNLKTWLAQKSAWAPNDLAARAISQELKPAYVPLWLVGAALTFQGDETNFNGLKQVFLQTDWIVPGMRRLPGKLVRELEPFDWNGLVEFNIDYLAGWPAFVYDVSVAAAAEQARQEMRSAAGGKLYRGVKDTPIFSGQSCRLVLFPLWISSYMLNGKIYHVLINGQSGKVAAERPTDWGKVSLGIAALLTVVGGLVFGLLRLVQSLPLLPGMNPGARPVFEGIIFLALSLSLLYLLSTLISLLRKH